MKVEKISINKLKPAGYNPRQISKKQYNDLKQSIEKFGLVDPIIIIILFLRQTLFFQVRYIFLLLRLRHLLLW